MKMRLFLLMILGFATGSGSAFAQARIVFSNDGYIVIDNAAQLVIGNPNPNAITDLSGANIVSESENDLLRWETANGTGAYRIPWTTGTNAKIPLLVNVTNAGTGSGHLLLSTHPDDDAVNNWNNFDYRPSDVTNMGGAGIPNNSPSVIDRFWRIQHQNYTAAPQATLDFGYHDVERTNPGNVIPAGSMFAQQFDPAQNAWLPNGSGTDQYPTLVVSGAVSGPFHRSWTLATVTTPLPLSGLEFQAERHDAEVHLHWELAENAGDWDHFVVERSPDGLNFAWIADQPFLQAQNAYQKVDDAPLQGLNHYRLQLHDLNGRVQYSEIRTVLMGERSIKVFPNPVVAGEDLQIELRGMRGESVDWEMYDLAGKLLAKGHLQVSVDHLLQTIADVDGLAKGICFLEVKPSQGQKQRFKVLLQ